MRRTPLARTPFRSTPRDPALSKSGKPRVRKHNDLIPLKVRTEVKERSGGRCEHCGDTAVHMHHRKMRSQGGRHEAVNLLHLCLKDHDYFHAHPEMAYKVGALVKSYDEPAEFLFWGWEA